MRSPSIISHGCCLIHNLGRLENIRGQSSISWTGTKKGFSGGVISPVGVIVPGWGRHFGGKRCWVQRHQTQIQTEQEEVRKGFKPVQRLSLGVGLNLLSSIVEKIFYKYI